MFSFFLSFQPADKALEILNSLEVDVDAETMLIQYVGTGVVRKAFGKLETCDSFDFYCFGFVCRYTK